MPDQAATPPERTGPTGLLLIDKAQGWTSHDVVAKARRLAGQRRIGHTGTLDPMATGLLVLCLGTATRLAEYLSGHDKHYEGVVALGATTDTDDAEGSVTGRAPVPPIDDSALRKLEVAFTGVLQQLPPTYSAVKKDGQRAYAIARRGGVVELAPREVTVSRLQLERRDETHLTIAVDCGAGTYIRSLARDIGAALACGGHLSALRRTRAGHFEVKDAVTIEELAIVAEAGLIEQLLTPADEAMLGIDVAVLGEEHARALQYGQHVTVEAAGPGASVRVYDATGTFVAVGSIDAGKTLRPGKVFSPG